MRENDREPVRGAAVPLSAPGVTSPTALLAVLAAITMLFAAFSSAYIVRRGLSSNWAALDLPRLVWAGPAALALTALARERRAWRSALLFAMAAGIVIAESCREVVAIPASRGSSAAAFFYIFSGAMLLCSIAGIVSLLRQDVLLGSLYWLYLAAMSTWLLLLLQVLR